jgi:hypothetical protein
MCVFGVCGMFRASSPNIDMPSFDAEVLHCSLVSWVDLLDMRFGIDTQQGQALMKDL